ncbi:short-chain collagen C4-like [Mytilus trossulus]|uniref:short-chain collagen C4-like n=1 Tax=Mytilus trossulus TaxID=6551 RepID=UPI00300584B6
MELPFYIFCILFAFMFPGLPTLQADQSVLDLFPDFHDMKSKISTTYIRWSRKQCPNNDYTELVYSGYVGGGNHDEKGSAVEPVCLPKDPDFVKTSGGFEYSRMYGAEFNSNNFFASNSQYQDVPCAVCRVRQASSIIMIPGKNRCYTGWNMEYNGYLASNYYYYPAAGSYICIDIQPEYVDGGSSWNGQSKLFFFVVAKCGSLRCPPYKEGYPLTCVVCSK